MTWSDTATLVVVALIVLAWAIAIGIPIAMFFGLMWRSFVRGEA